MTEGSAYCPYELDVPLESFGYVGTTIATELGQVFAWHHLQRGALCVALLHGVGMSSSSWTPLLQAAARVGIDTTSWVLIDIPGFGRSQDLDGSVSLAQVGAAIGAVLNRLGASEFHLVGHSMGGFLALDMSTNLAASVLSVTSISGAYRTVVDIVNHPVRTAFSDPQAWLTYGSLVALARLGPAARPVLKLLNRTRLLRLALISSVAHPRRVRQSLLDSIVDDNRPQSFLHAQETGREYDVRTAWRRIHQPVLSIVGVEDKLVPVSDHDLLVESADDVRALTLSHAAHFSHIERPHEVVQALASFLS